MTGQGERLGGSLPFRVDSFASSLYAQAEYRASDRIPLTIRREGRGHRLCGNCPQNADKTWSETAKTLLPQWWEARISRQKEMDVSIAAKAVFESF